MSDWQALDQQYLMSTYHRLPIAIERAEGNHLYDTGGRSYLDLFTGLAVNILGHSHPAVMQALRQQGERYLHVSNKFLNPPAIQLARRLVESSIPGKVFFTNSGAEATETAVKLVHKWSREPDRARQGFVVMEKSFHGRTLGAIRLTRQPGVYQDFPQPAIPVFEVPPNDIDALKTVCERERPAAILAEPILGSGGVQPLEKDYLKAMAVIARERGMLLLLDEIQTGIGRTGTFFAHQAYGITPDLILFAKGVGGGLPLGGILASDRIASLFRPGDHGTTFAPSPLSAALGLAVVEELLDRGGLEQGRKNAAYLWEALSSLREKHPDVIGTIRGKGMMIGLDTRLSPEEALRLQRGLLEDGVLVDIAQQRVIRLLPPLTLKPEETDFFVDRLSTRLSRIGEGIS
ncbi:aspartate aminotransferase family protein [Desmospora profundinema]|uniref:Acetylornithine aminotransferase n=1 Tax=Desmospora profundinema TaxID=1571184 RepID=A0ABU1IMS6_9BACL|nr:acetylornithine transaminase [Desmospora profundinema]MDR6226082.1 acetylornithine aminotransferase [Desmospora profundinema]